jgi:DNA-directed RNA polymerase subunit E'/Rpb7
MEPRRLTPEQQRWVEQVTPRVLEIARAVRHRIGTLSLDDYLSAGNEALGRATHAPCASASTPPPT